MSRYRKIEVRTWSDEKFRALSAIPPSGQGLWFFLLTGPHTTAIPGLFRAGRAAMAEELGWEVEAFDEAFLEVSAQGMAKADFKARLVWLPKALQHNKPESPNVVRGWRAELDLLPECDLKREAIASIRASLSELGKAYLQAFDELFSPVKSGNSEDVSKPSGKPSGKPSAKTTPNQEQEQEQEQEKDNAACAADTVKPAKSTKSAGIACPADVSSEVFSDFLAVRKAKRAPLTATALDGIKSEAQKAGMSLADALVTCCSRGWTGFKAEWVMDSRRAAAAPAVESFRERDERLAREKMASFLPGIAAKAPAAARAVIDITPTFPAIGV